MNVHDKMAPDNIIKKIKAIIFKNILIFLNNLLEGETNSNIKFLNLDYNKYINKLNISFEKKLLSMKLKDLLSLDISSKFKEKDDNNKEIIKIIEKEVLKISYFSLLTFRYFFRSYYNFVCFFGGFAIIFLNLLMISSILKVFSVNKGSIFT